MKNVHSSVHSLWFNFHLVASAQYSHLVAGYRNHNNKKYLRAPGDFTSKGIMSA